MIESGAFVKMRSKDSSVIRLHEPILIFSRVMAAFRRFFPMLFLTGLSAACVAQTQSTNECISYEPSVVKLTGTLVRKTFPGPPNYESVRKGDRSETYWLLELPRPICVDESKEQRDPAQKDVRRIQLVVNEETYKNQKALVGRRVVATGTLFGAITGHHHTPVLLQVKTLAKAE
jgi:hypothetical protein